MSDGITDAYRKISKDKQLQMEIQRLQALNNEMQFTIENISKLLGENAKEELDNILKNK